MTSNEHIQHEAIKTLLKQIIMNNPELMPLQKQQACNNIDIAAKQADWIVEMMNTCGFLR